MYFTHTTFTLPNATVPRSSSAQITNRRERKKNASFHGAFIFCFPCLSQLEGDKPRCSLSTKPRDQLNIQKAEAETQLYHVFLV